MTTEGRARLRKSIDAHIRAELLSEDEYLGSVWGDPEGDFKGPEVEEECRAAWAAYAKARGIEE